VSDDDLIRLLLAQRAASEGPRWTRALESDEVILRLKGEVK
jgi:hypothetical protein